MTSLYFDFYGKVGTTSYIVVHKAQDTLNSALLY